MAENTDIDIDIDNEEIPEETNLTARYYILNMLPSGAVFIIAAALIFFCAYLFLKAFFALNGTDQDFINMFSGRYYNPLKALFFLLFGLVGGILPAFLIIMLLFLASSLFFPLDSIRKMFIKSANIARAEVIRIYDEDVGKYDEHCNADVRVTPIEGPEFRARVRVPLKTKQPIEKGSLILVAYSYYNNDNRKIEKIISVTKNEIPREKFEEIIRPPAPPEDEEKKSDEIISEDDFAPANFTEMEILPEEFSGFADDDVGFADDDIGFADDDAGFADDDAGFADDDAGFADDIR